MQAAKQPKLLASLVYVAVASYCGAAQPIVPDLNATYFVANASDCLGRGYPCQAFEKELCINTSGKSICTFRSLC